MRRRLLQYFVVCEHDNKILGKHTSVVGRASTVNSAKATIRSIRRHGYGLANPRNFKVYDCFAPVDEKTGFVPCVYEEE